MKGSAANVLGYGGSVAQDMNEGAVSVSGHGGNCCQSFRIWW